jgi:hypothetical protein
MCFVKIYEDKKIIQLLIILFGFCFVALFPNWSLNVYIYPYFIMGYYYAKYDHQLGKIQLIKYITIVLFPIMLFFFEKKHYIYTTGILGDEYSLIEYISVDGYRWIIGLIGSIFVITIIELVHKFSLGKQLGSCLQQIGKNTLQIYVLSVVFLSSYLPIGLRIIRRIQPNKMYMWCWENILVFYFITFIIAIMYTIGLNYIITKTRNTKISKLIFGR